MGRFEVLWFGFDVYRWGLTALCACFGTTAVCAHDEQGLWVTILVSNCSHGFVMKVGLHLPKAHMGSLLALHMHRGLPQELHMHAASGNPVRARTVVVVYIHAVMLYAKGY